MRIPFSSLLATRPGQLALSLLLTSQLLLIHTATAFSVTPVPLPDLGLDALGRVAFAGDFDAISLYQYAEQNQSAPGEFSSIYQRLPNGVLSKIKLGASQDLDTDGDVRAMCAFQRDGKIQGYIIGGNFTSVDGLQTQGGIAQLDATTGKPSAMAGLIGNVNALYCDSSRGQVYVGGEFDLTGKSSKNAVVWNNNWQEMPFDGFNGPVSAIAQTPNNKIVFGGQFDGLGNGTSGVAQNNTQSLPVGSATIESQTSSGRTGFSDPKTIACKSNPETQGSDSTWLLADNTAGFWRATFGFGFQPTKLRLYNTNFEDRGTKTWRYTALPDGGIMNFTFVNPVTKKQEFCDALCPLPQDNTTAQDFYFVNQVGMNAFRLDISDWYGQGGGLNAVEVFQTQIFSYAIDEFNKPSCGGATSGASASATGQWSPTESHQSSSKYLTSTLTVDQVDPSKEFVVFQPDIPQTGKYTIKLYTPGCQGDNTCATRGRVNVTVGMGTNANSTQPSSTLLFQTNDYDKYDTIFDGVIDVAGGDRPSVTLAPVAGQKTDSGVLTVVAQRVGFEIKNATAGGVNGLFEYDPDQQEVDSDLSDSVIDTAGTNLTPSSNAIISTLATVGDNLYIGGNFSGSGLNYVFAIGKDAQDPTTMNGNGLNGQVTAMYGDSNSKTLYVGGKFNNTQDNSAQGLNSVAAYSNDKWQALGAGVNGAVMHIIPLSMNITGTTPEDVLGITGFFTQVNGFSNSTAFPARNFAIWVPSKSDWLHNLDVQTPIIEGHLMAFAEIPNADAPSNRLYAGTISSGGLGANGAAVLNYGDDNLSLERFAASIRAQQQQASRKRSLSDDQNLNTTGIVTAAFYKENNMNKTILAGHFAATGSDGDNITNVAIIDGKDSDKISGFSEEVDSNSTVAAVSVLDGVLFAGGRLTGHINDIDVAGVVSYDLGTNKFGSSQPPALQGTNVTVNAIAPRPKSKDLYVAGQFDSAGALSCPALCIWNTDRNQWTAPGASLTGVATSLFWVSDTKVLITGNLTAGNNQTKVFSYDSTTSQFEPISGANDLPGPVTALAPAVADGSQFWAAGQASDGSAFLQRFDGTKWLPVQDQFGKGTVIRGIQVLPLSKDHGDSDLIDRNQDLLILGTINITAYNATVSGAIFNGTKTTPFLLTSTTDGNPSSLSQIFVENPSSFFVSGSKHLALGFVVLISLAIALGLTFLLVVAGVIIEWWRKKAQGYSPAPTSYTDRMGNVGRVPPEQLFGTLSGPRAPAI
ncbi:hypothetical protein P280DRAFT_156594 [Massarina eburnea CBS 473.64]|uniref:Cellular morphogenesis protein n=1 Tax=Massarina eburnea CBS 473.64 TaxID=1395130 RepID=A0A6A6RP43_9PLEO|nr:hypothetical protein P280DRAFT_156594 [Massarina eburnea CBS 473.64]